MAFRGQGFIPLLPPPKCAPVGDLRGVEESYEGVMVELERVSQSYGELEGVGES